MSDKLTILLIEDDPFLSSVLQLKLEKENFEVIRASDGEEALIFFYSKE